MMTGKSRKQQLEEMLAEEPNDPFLRYGLAMEFVSAGHDEEAVNCFQQLLEATPDYVPGHMQAALALTRLNRLEEARRIYQNGIVVAQQKGDVKAADEMSRFLEELN